MLKSCVAFTRCINEINVTQVNNSHGLDVVYNLLVYSENTE